MAKAVWGLLCLLAAATVLDVSSTSVCDPPCHNGGQCILAEASSRPACRCPAGYTGPTCLTTLSTSRRLAQTPELPVGEPVTPANETASDVVTDLSTLEPAADADPVAGYTPEDAAEATATATATAPAPAAATPAPAPADGTVDPSALEPVTDAEDPAAGLEPAADAAATTATPTPEPAAAAVPAPEPAAAPVPAPTATAADTGLGGVEPAADADPVEGYTADSQVTAPPAPTPDASATPDVPSTEVPDLSALEPAADAEIIPAIQQESAAISGAGTFVPVSAPAAGSSGGGGSSGLPAWAAAIIAIAVIGVVAVAAAATVVVVRRRRRAAGEKFAAGSAAAGYSRYQDDPMALANARSVVKDIETGP